MSVRFRVFASGRLKGTFLPPAYEVLYKVPPGKSVVINSMRFTYGPYIPTSARFTIMLHRGNTTSIIFPDGKDGPLGMFKMAVEDCELPMSADEELRANVGAIGDVGSQYVDKIDFIICGVERDI